MTAAAKAKGSLFESQVADYLQSQNIRAKRLPRTGVNDIGDVAWPIWHGGSTGGNADGVIVCELKNRKQMTLAGWIQESEVEAGNYEAKYPADGAAIPIVVHKRKGKGVHLSYVTMSLDTFVDLLRKTGAV